MHDVRLYMSYRDSASSPLHNLQHSTALHADQRRHLGVRADHGGVVRGDVSAVVGVGVGVWLVGGQDGRWTVAHDKRDQLHGGRHAVGRAVQRDLARVVVGVGVDEDVAARALLDLCECAAVAADHEADLGGGAVDRHVDLVA